MSIKRHVPGSTYAALNAMVDEIGASAGTSGSEAAGDFEDVTKFTILKQLDPDQARVEMSFARVVRLSKHFGVMAALKHFAEQMGCVVVPRAVTSADACFIGLLTKVAKESGDTLTAVSAALADQHVDESELLKIKQEARQLREAACALELAADARLAAIQKVTPIRGTAA